MNTHITTLPKWQLQVVQVGQSIATTMILYGQPYYAKRALGWNPSSIALAQIAIGLLTAIGSVLGGRVIEGRGCRASLKIGLVGVGAGALAGLALPEGWNMVTAIALVGCFQGFIWPAIEAALNRGEPQHRVQHLIISTLVLLVLPLGRYTGSITPKADPHGSNTSFSIWRAWYSKTTSSHSPSRRTIC